MRHSAITYFAESDETSAGPEFPGRFSSRDLYGRSDAAEAAGQEDGTPDGWSTLLLPAGKDQETAWGFGGEAHEVSPALQVWFSSLDSLENNQHTSTVPDYYRHPTGRGKFCGRRCCTGVDPKTGRRLYVRINCRSWSCSYCGPKRAIAARKAIQKVAEALGLRYFLTLTLDPKKLQNPKSAVPHLRDSFNMFREYLRRKFGDSPSYVCILEFTQQGVPHLHILLDRYIDQRWISNAWDKVGGGRIVFIKRVTVHKVARYLSKYLTKELLLSAPKGTRRITTARSIKLFPKFDSGIAWEMLQTSIWQELRDAKMRNWTRQLNLNETISIEFDEEQFLKAFWIIDAWHDKPRTEGSTCDLLIESLC